MSIIVRHHLGDQFADDVEWLVSEDLEDGLYDCGIIEPIQCGSVLVRLAEPCNVALTLNNHATAPERNS